MAMRTTAAKKSWSLKRRRFAVLRKDIAAHPLADAWPRYKLQEVFLATDGEQLVVILARRGHFNYFWNGHIAPATVWTYGHRRDKVEDKITRWIGTHG